MPSFHDLGTCVQPTHMFLKVDNCFCYHCFSTSLFYAWMKHHSFCSCHFQGFNIYDLRVLNKYHKNVIQIHIPFREKESGLVSLPYVCNWQQLIIENNFFCVSKLSQKTFRNVNLSIKTINNFYGHDLTFFKLCVYYWNNENR